MRVRLEPSPHILDLLSNDAIRSEFLNPETTEELPEPNDSSHMEAKLRYPAGSSLKAFSLMQTGPVAAELTRPLE